MRGLCFVALCALLVLAAACAEGGASKKVANRDLKGEVEQIFKDNPDIVLNVLKEHSEAVLEIVRDGAIQEQRRQMRAQWQEELANPKKPVIDPDRPIRGKRGAPVTLVEYSDFQCPYCGQAAETVKQLMQKYPGTVRMVFKHLPLPRHEYALLAAKYFEAVARQDQDKAWQFHDALFANPEALSANGEQRLKEVAGQLHLDMELLAEDVASEVVLKRIEQDKEEAASFEFRGRPSSWSTG